MKNKNFSTALFWIALSVSVICLFIINESQRQIKLDAIDQYSECIDRQIKLEGFSGSKQEAWTLFANKCEK